MEYFKKIISDLFKDDVLKTIYIKLLEALLIFLVSILITRYLGPVKYGKFSYVLSIVFVLKPIYNLGTNYVLQSELSRNKSSESIINQLLSIRLISFFLVSIFAFLILQNFLKQDNLFLFSILQISYGMRIFDLFINSLFVFQKGIESVKINLISSFKLLILISISYLFSTNIYLISFAYLINYLSDIVVIILIFKKINLFYLFSKLKLDLSNFKNYLIKGLPIMGSGIISMLIIRSDIIIVANMMDEFSAGIYSAPSRIVLQINSILYLITLNLVPKLKVNFLSRKNNNLTKLYNYTWLYSSFSAILFLLSVPFIIKYGFGSSYIESIKLIPLLSVVVFLNGLTLTDNAFLNFYGFGRTIFFKSIISLFSNILLNIILIPLLGIQGALLSLLVSSVFNTFGGIIFNKKLKSHYRNLIFPELKYFFINGIFKN